jgi:hypothetical protein
MTAGSTEMTTIATAQKFAILRASHNRTRQAHGVAA